MNLNDLETFLLVAEHGTFAEAARRLRVPKSTVTRRVSRLEDELGRELLHRATRSIALSDEGRALLDRCGPLLRELGEVERALGDGRDAPCGQLRVTTSVDLGTTEFIGGLVATYAQRYDQVRVALEITNRNVDLLEEDLDVAVRVHTSPLPDTDHLMARRLGTMATGVYASPRYLRSRGAVEPCESLAGHITVRHALGSAEWWPTTPTITADDYVAVASILVAGGGIGALPTWLAAPHVERGTLTLLPIASAAPQATVTLVWLRSRHLAPRVRAFIELAAEHAARPRWLG